MCGIGAGPAGGPLCKGLGARIAASAKAAVESNVVLLPYGNWSEPSRIWNWDLVGVSRDLPTADTGSMAGGQASTTLPRPGP